MIWDRGGGVAHGSGQQGRREVTEKIPLLVGKVQEYGYRYGEGGVGRGRGRNPDADSLQIL